MCYWYCSPVIWPLNVLCPLIAITYFCLPRFEKLGMQVWTIFSSTLKSDDHFSRLMKNKSGGLLKVTLLFWMLVPSTACRRITCPPPLWDSELKAWPPWSQFSGVTIRPYISRAQSDKNLGTVCGVGYYCFIPFVLLIIEVRKGHTGQKEISGSLFSCQREQKPGHGYTGEKS